MDVQQQQVIGLSGRCRPYTASFQIIHTKTTLISQYLLDAHPETFLMCVQGSIWFSQKKLSQRYQ
jgi:hypothetical protein